MEAPPDLPPPPIFPGLPILPALPALHETADLLAVNKPPGLVVVPARPPRPDRAGPAQPPQDEEPSLWHLLMQRRGERLFVVHRLDRETSGVVLFARNAAAHRDLCLAFERGEVRKTYLALCLGALPDRGVIDVPLHDARRGKTRPAHPGEPGARPATTAYQVLRRRMTPAGDVLLVEVHPRTGRQHQIRVHLRHAGAPLLGDPLYGKAATAAARERGAFPIPPRLPLHAARIELSAPRTGEPLRIEAPLPQDLEALFQTL